MAALLVLMGLASEQSMAIPERSPAIPLFDEIDSHPLARDEPAHTNQPNLQLCFCPLCTNGSVVFGPKRPVSWILICRIILFCLMQLHKNKRFFSLKKDMHWFVADHWYIFGQLDQFRTNPARWKKSFLDGLSHSSFFESGTPIFHKKNLWQLRRANCPWLKTTQVIKEEDEREPLDEYSSMTTTTTTVIRNSPLPDASPESFTQSPKQVLAELLRFVNNNLVSCDFLCRQLQDSEDARENADKIRDLLGQLGFLQKKVSKVLGDVDRLAL